jgi:hypothetical protein
MSENLTENDEDKSKDELIIVEDESKLEQAPEEEANDEDERVAANNPDDDERESIRERRRKEKVERKQRRDEAIKRDKLELDFLRKRNDELERRMSAQELRAHQVDLSAYDAHISQAVNEAEMADRVIAKAVEANNGDDVAKALKYRDQAMQRINQLKFAKQQAAENRPQSKTGIDEMVMHHAQEFMKENPWYDAQGRDEDSSIVLAIDQSLAKDGYNAQTEEYWDELRRRVARRLPEKVKESRSSESEERQPRGGPAVGSGKEHAPSSTRKEVYISPERKQALIEAGVWDDPVLRMKYVKRYAEYDRQRRS